MFIYFVDIKIEWANSLGLLAVGGNVQPASSNLFINNVQFYTIYGTLLYRIHLPETVRQLSVELNLCFVSVCYCICLLRITMF